MATTTGTPKLDIGKTFLILIIAVFALYLIGNFLGVTEGIVEFKLPADIDKTTFTSLKVILIGIVTYGMFVLIRKFQKGVTTKEDLAKNVIMMLLVGTAIYFLWDKVIVQVFNAGSLDEITLSVAKKAGLIP